MRQWNFVQIEVENEIIQKYKHFGISLSFINRINDLFYNIKELKVVSNKFKSMQKNQFQPSVTLVN